MERRAQIFARMLAVALIGLVGAGFHAYSLEGRLEATQESIGALEQDRNLWKSKAEEAEGVIEAASASLDHCSAQVVTLKSQLVAPGPSLRP